MTLKIIVLALLLLAMILAFPASAISGMQISNNTMAANTSVDGYTVNASAFSAAAQMGFYAFDGNNGDNGWQAPVGFPQWVGQSLPRAMNITNYTIYPFSTTTYAPRDWTIRASNIGFNNPDNVTLDTRSGISSGWTGGSGRTFNITGSPLAYKYIWIDITAGNGGAQAIIDEMYFYGEDPAAPVANFTISNTTGTTPLFTVFNDTSLNAPTSWEYSFWTLSNTTEAILGTTRNLSWSFPTGNYSIMLNVTNPIGYNKTPLYSKWVNVSDIPSPPTANFSAFNTAGTAPFTTYLYDTSTNLTPGPATFYWDLGDGNTSTSQNLYYTWNIIGTYTVKHSASNGLSTNWSNQTDYVTVGTPTPPVVAPVASFYGGPQLGAVPLKVFLTDVSSNTPTSWNWSLGDGTFNETQNPMHIYTSSGFFTVNLTATNSAGSNMTSQSNFVMVY